MAYSAQTILHKGLILVSMESYTSKYSSENDFWGAKLTIYQIIKPKLSVGHNGPHLGGYVIPEPMGNRVKKNLKKSKTGFTRTYQIMKGKKSGEIGLKWTYENRKSVNFFSKSKK